MQQQLKILLFHLVASLLYLSTGAGSLYAYSKYELREQESFPSEKVTAANPISIAVRKNLYEGISELSQDSYFPNSSVVPGTAEMHHILRPDSEKFHFRRDLRQTLKIQLFPKHFFL